MITGTTEELLGRILQAITPCPEICNNTDPYGSGTYDIKTGLRFKTNTTPASSGTLVFNGIDPLSGGSYVSAPGSTVGTWLPNNGDFTVEWFQKQTTVTSHPRIFSIGHDTTAVFGVSIESHKVYTWPSATGHNWSIPSSAHTNVWAHIALVRSGGTMTCYLNGSSVGTPQVDTTIITGSTYNLYIGSDGYSTGDSFTGNITNFRWTNSVVYTGNFSPITSPLKVLPQTKLLMLGGSVSNPAVDSSNKNVLTNFNTTWSAETPF